MLPKYWLSLHTNPKLKSGYRVGGNRKSKFNCQVKKVHSRLWPKGLCTTLGGVVRSLTAFEEQSFISS